MRNALGGVCSVTFSRARKERRGRSQTMLVYQLYATMNTLKNKLTISHPFVPTLCLSLLSRPHWSLFFSVSSSVITPFLLSLLLFISSFLFLFPYLFLPLFLLPYLLVFQSFSLSFLPHFCSFLSSVLPSESFLPFFLLVFLSS